MFIEFLCCAFVVSSVEEIERSEVSIDSPWSSHIDRPKIETEEGSPSLSIFFNLLRLFLLFSLLVKRETELRLLFRG